MNERHALRRKVMDQVGKRRELARNGRQGAPAASVTVDLDDGEMLVNFVEVDLGEEEQSFVGEKRVRFDEPEGDSDTEMTDSIPPQISGVGDLVLRLQDQVTLRDCLRHRSRLGTLLVLLVLSHSKEIRLRPAQTRFRLLVVVVFLLRPLLFHKFYSIDQ
jgi:hypothetical protein